MRNNDSAPSGLTAELKAAYGCFGKALKAARKRVRLSQAALAKEIKKTRVVISNYESGRSAPNPDEAVQLAKAVKEDPGDFVLLATLKRGLLGPDDSAHGELLNAVNRLRGRVAGRRTTSEGEQGLPGFLSLADGMDAFSPLVVFVGDKREEEPQTAGDLFAFSASTVDDRYLPSLCLSPDTEKISDKILMTADDLWLRQHFGHKNILSIGSAAANLFSRQFNDHFLFRLAIGRTTKSKWEETRRRMLDLHTPASLMQFYEESKPDLKQTMRMFKPPGFVDFNYPYLILGMDLSYAKDFAVISLGTNPFAEPGSPYFAILAAGVHHPGTAHAVKFLGDPRRFVKHPFGGVLEIEVPSKKCDPREIFWHNKIENCHAAWHTAGEREDALQYDLNKMRTNLTRWAAQFDGVAPVIDIALERDEIDRHLRLLDSLVHAKKGEADPFRDLSEVESSGTAGPASPPAAHPSGGR